MGAVRCPFSFLPGVTKERKRNLRKQNLLALVGEGGRIYHVVQRLKGSLRSLPGVRGGNFGFSFAKMAEFIRNSQGNPQMLRYVKEKVLSWREMSLSLRLNSLSTLTHELHWSLWLPRLPNRPPETAEED